MSLSSIHIKQIQTRLLESAEVKKKVAEECLESILKATELVTETFKSGGKVLICGNGGSAADSQHMAGEFVCVLNKNFERPGLPVIALTTDTSILTAHANDLGFQNIFKRQVEALGKKGDLLIGITTSGNSANILTAIKAANQLKIRTIILTGNRKGVEKLADVVISVPSSNTQYIQESHIAIEHIICELVEQNFFELSKNRKTKNGH